MRIDDPRERQPGRRSPRSLARLLLSIYFSLVLVLAIAFYTVPGYRVEFWTPIVLLTVVAMVVGVRIHRPSHPAGWYLLAAATFCFILGDATYLVLTEGLGQDHPFPSIADVFYLGTYPLFAGGLLLLIRRRAATRDRGGALDAAILTFGVGVVVWVLLVLPAVENDALSTMQRVVSIAAPIGDLLVLAVLLRLVIGGGLRLRSAQILAIGAVGLLASDFAYELAQAQLDWEFGGWTQVGWIAFYISWGAAALHPSMREVTDTADHVNADLGPVRMAVFAALGLIAPTALLAGRTEHLAAAGVFAGGLYLLVLARLGGIVAGHRQSLARERVLRATGESLVSAQDEQDITAAALVAVSALTADLQDVDAALYLVGPDDSLEVAASAGDLGETEPLWAMAVAAGSGSGQRGSGPLSVNALRFDHDLRGMLVVRAKTALSPDVHGALTTLAAQVALTLESHRRAAALQQRQQEVHFGTLIQNSSDIILVLDKSGVLTYGLPSMQRILGFDNPLVTGDLREMVHPDDLDAALSFMATMEPLADTEVLTGYWRLRHADGEYRSFEIVSRNMLHEPTVAGIVLTMRDVTHRRALEDQLKYQAFHDDLTDLANRALFQQRAAQALARVVGTPGLVAMVVLDLDDFKEVNDSHGHGVGDAVLRAVATRLAAATRPGDTAARLGGDEFGVLVEGVPDADTAESVVTRLLDAFVAPFVIEDQLFYVHASAGLVVVGGEDQTVDLAELLLRADLALYASKERGKGLFQRYETEQRTDMIQRVTRRTELRAAVKNQEFVLRYQPIVKIDTGQVVGVEALVRWQHPRHGLVGPNEFITLAEETGLIVPLGRWVLDAACKQAALWQGTPLAGLSMSVNVSGRQLQEHTFIGEVRSALARHRIKPRSLVLELTETVLFHEGSAIPGSLGQLKGLGVTIAIDDFGTGYSSLGYLQHYAVDVIKMDKSFIDGLGTGDTNARALVRAVVSLSHEMNLRIIAEGIERPEQRNELLSLGCGMGQGYLYAKPIEATELARLLEHSDCLGGTSVPGLSSQRVPLVRT